MTVMPVQRKRNFLMESLQQSLRDVGKWLFEPPRPVATRESSIWLGMSVEPCRFTEQLARLRVSLEGWDSDPEQEVSESEPVRAEKQGGTS